MNALPTRTDTGYCLGNLVAEGLPPRQSQVLLMRALGHSVKEIAETMNCSAANVQQAITNLFFKLGANSSHELVTRAFISDHLRKLSCAALFLFAFALNPAEHSTMARNSRTQQRPTQSARVQRGSNNKKLWS